MLRERKETVDIRDQDQVGIFQFLLKYFFCSDDTEDVDEDESDDDDDEIEKEDVEDEEEDSDDEADDDFMVNREKVRLSILYFAKLCLETCFLLFRTYQI